MVLVLIDTALGDDAPDAAGGVDAGVAAQNGAGIEHRVAAHLHIVAQHGAHLFSASLQQLISLDDHWGLVGLHVGGDGASAHVALIAQNRVAHVVVVGHLNAVKENDVFQFHGVAHHAAFANQSGATDESAVAHLGVGADDTGGAQVGGRHHLGGAVYPHLGLRLVILLRGQSTAQGENQLGDSLQCLPGIFKLPQIISSNGMREVKTSLHLINIEEIHEVFNH